jgi:F0F1-type ATP synthase assembly protein I
LVVEPAGTNKSSSAPKEKKSELSPWSYASIGTQLAITLLLGFYVGYRLDIHFQSSPWYTLVGCFVGLAAGLYNLFKSLQD